MTLAVPGEPAGLTPCLPIAYRYDGLDQTIINATLVRCREGVFAAEATPDYLLLLSTPSEVRLLSSHHMLAFCDCHRSH